MAEKRMFALSVVDSDAFLDMPLSSQALYFHLSMRADDDGFINNPKKIQRIIGATDGDAEILVARKFIIPFETGVIVIRHWKLNNYLRSDRYHPTVHQREKAMLSTDENGAYYINKRKTGIPMVDKRSTENREDKNRLDKNRIEKNSIGYVEKEDNNTDKDISFIPSTIEKNNIQKFVDTFNAIGHMTPCHYIDLEIENAISIILSTYDPIEITRAFRNLADSSLSVNIDWFVNLENFRKVYNGEI